LKPTLEDIANKTGYSISTVSRALSGSKKISLATRKLIFKTANEINYPVYTTSDGDKLLDDLKIHFVITGFHQGEFYSSFFHGMNKAEKKRSIQLSLISIQKPFKELLISLKALSKKGHDGLILYTPTFDQSEYAQIKDALPKDYPVISNHLVENPVFPTVAFDTYSGGYLAAKHFAKQGYMTCGIVEGPFHKAGTRNRVNGFKDYIQQHDGMELVWQYSGDHSFDSGVDAFKEFHNLKSKPRAFFATNDVMAHAFMQEALIEEYDIPGDIAVVGYDDLPICKNHKPSISSIHTSYEKLGTITIDKMKNMLTNPDQAKSILNYVPVSLVERESS
jgi:DNA-binding LacI/PurR family transcriptional regulator